MLSEQGISQYFDAIHFLSLLHKLITNFKTFPLDKSFDDNKGKTMVC